MDLIYIDNFRLSSAIVQEEAKLLCYKLLDENKNEEEIENVIKNFCEKRILLEKAKKLKAQNELAPRFKTRTFENFIASNETQRLAKIKATSYCENIREKLKNNVNLAIMGKGAVGSGKSHIAGAITNRLNDMGYPTKFINTVDFLNGLRNDFNLDPYISVEVLVIDDLGKEYLTKWAIEQLYRLFNRRSEEMKPIIITTEWDLARLKEYYNKFEENRGNAILSRFMEFYNAITLDCEDYRARREA